MALTCLLILVQGAAASQVRRSIAMPSMALPGTLRFSVYLPDGYGLTQRRYPVVFLLHGTDGGENDWLEMGQLRETADQLIAAGTIQPLLIVTPAAGNSWYVDNPDPGGAGLYATAFISELLPYIDAHFATTGGRPGRAVVGLSMGGFGAMRFALTRPDLFAAAASLSGALFTPHQQLDDDDITDLHGAFGLPFDQRRLDANNPFRMIAQLQDAARMPAIYLASGGQDWFDLDENTARFYLALKRVGVHATMRIREGGHDWKFWSSELAPALRFVSRALSTGGAATALGNPGEAPLTGASLLP